ncbi:MAG: MoaD/ThiS family protein [Syntrophomonadales bacterium]|jgi:sulfur carrier protein ThiS
MQVHYRAVGELKQKMERPEGVITPDEPLNVEGLLDLLGLNREDLVIMINGRKADGEDRLQDGDQVDIVPFVVGG